MAGSRPGERRGGRKPLTRNKANAERTARAAATGMMPCEVMLEAMRYFRGLAARHAAGGPAPDERKSIQYLREAASIAKDAAPYYHSRLSQTTIQSNPDKPVVHELKVKFV
jgi:hypothetical protein